MIRDLTRCSEQTENKAMKQANLRTQRTVARLPLADHMNRFIAGDRAPCSPEGSKMLACVNPTFDDPVVLFQEIIEVLYRTVLTILLNWSPAPRHGRKARNANTNRRPGESPPAQTDAT